MIVELASFHPLLKSRGLHTFEDLMKYPFGGLGSRFILLNMFVLAYGAMVAYLLIIKDTIPTILGLAHGTAGGIERELIMVATTIVIILPIAMQRDMASLAFTSLISVSADAALVVFMAAVAPIKETVTAAGGLGQILKNDGVQPTLFVGVGILSTAFACQHSAFIVSGSLHEKTSTRWSRVTCVSLVVAALMCLTLGITGYLGFLDKTEGNVLNNFRANSIEANAARGLLAFTMFFTYPMECFVARHVLVKLLFKGDSDGPIDENGKPLAVFCCMTRRQVVTIAIYVLTLIPALIVNDLGPVLSITGALGGSCLCYIAPGVVYLGVNGDAFLEYLRTLCSGSKSSSRDFGEIELPVAGEANVTMTAITDGDLDQQSKPWWWYPMIMPLWVYLASSGKSGMRKKLEATSSKFNSNVDDDTETIGPCPRDYWISIFFIVFGVVAAIAGVGSNLYQFV